MNDTPQHPLYVATRRLVKALDRLEGNLKAMRAAQDADAGEDQEIVLLYEQENAALKEEREKLNGSIAQLQRQYNDLHKVASNIYSRLDDSIQKLTQIIE